MAVHACSECGVTVVHGRFGDGPYASSIYCTDCWDKWDQDCGTLSGRMQFPVKISQGWEPQDLLKSAELERLCEDALNSASNGILEFDAVSSDSPSIDLSRPCIIKNAMSACVCNNWSFDELLKCLGTLRVPWRPCFGDWTHPQTADVKRNSTTLEGYLTSDEVRPGVVFDQDDPSLEIHSELSRFYHIPITLSRLLDKRKETKPVFSAGRQNTGTGFHSHAENWLAQMFGRKFWWIVPRDRPCGSIQAPWLYLLPGRRPRFALTCLTKPGDVVYVPKDWAHATWNIDDISVSFGRIGVDEDAATPPAEILKALQLNWQRVSDSRPLPSSVQGHAAGSYESSPTQAEKIIEWVAVD